MATRIEFYERLREHIPDEAARLIAEEMSTEGGVAAKLEHLATRDDTHRIELSVEKLRSSQFRWMLTFFVPLWAGVYGTLIAIVVKS